MLRDHIIHDADLPGFGLRVRKRGGRGTWTVVLNRRGKWQRLTLGRCGEISADDARKAARAALVAAALDGLPKPPPVPSAVTFGEYADEFLADYARHWKPSTAKTNARYIRREIMPMFGKRAVAELARTDIGRWRDSYAGEREAIFNRAVPVLSVMMTYAEQFGYRRRGSNPCRGIARYKRQLPERYLSAKEYRRLGRRLAEIEDERPAEVAVVRLLLFTGARLGEITTLEWSWVQGTRLMLPDSKTGPKTVHLNAAGRGVLASVNRHAETDLVFPDRTGVRPINMQNFWRKFRKTCALPDVRLHDLRHSFASVAIADGVPLSMIGRLLGHELPETTARYAHLADDTVAEAVQRVSGSIAACMGVRA